MGSEYIPICEKCNRQNETTSQKTQYTGSIKTTQNGRIYLKKSKNKTELDVNRKKQLRNNFCTLTTSNADCKQHGLLQL